jgi:hypothetical protein
VRPRGYLFAYILLLLVAHGSIDGLLVDLLHVQLQVIEVEERSVVGQDDLGLY